MPRYFFNTSDGRKDRDDLGVVLADDHAVRVYAVQYAGELLKSEPESISQGVALHVCVQGERGDELFSVNCDLQASGR